MIKRLNANAVDTPNCCGGEGIALLDALCCGKTIYPKANWVGMVTLNKDATVGYHQHTGDMEIYTMVSGRALFNDNGTEVILEVGDTAITYDGESHSIKPYECDSISFLAIVCAK